MNCRPLHLAIFQFLLAATVGCSSDTGKGKVTGIVTLDDQPLKSGLIRFVPADGQTPTAEAMISDGKFSAEVPVGDKRVSISAPKVVGQRQTYQTPGAPTVDVIEELLPARYNANSELTLNVAGGHQEAPFKLQSGQ
jgi:hypothetical protein